MQVKGLNGNARQGRLARGLVLGLAALALAGLTAGAVQAETSRVAIAFSWNSNGSAAAQLKSRKLAAQSVVWGRSGWICVPAGFGRHSYCYMQ